jgi:hypothetical protein
MFPLNPSSSAIAHGSCIRCYTQLRSVVQFFALKREHYAKEVEESVQDVALERCVSQSGYFFASAKMSIYAD